MLGIENSINSMKIINLLMNKIFYHEIYINCDFKIIHLFITSSLAEESWWV